MSHRIEVVNLAGPAGALEAQCMIPGAPVAGAALLCHPHPLHGGTMHTKALSHAARALVAAGLPVLRFNFRGVGRSAGTHTGGPGEQDDARAALAWLASRYPGQPLLAGGFSFGAWVGLQVGNADPRVTALVGIAPPLSLFDFDFLENGTADVLAVAGDRDEFCDAPSLEQLGTRLGARAAVRILPGARHLFIGHLRLLHDAVFAFVKPRFGRL